MNATKEHIYSSDEKEGEPTRVATMQVLRAMKATIARGKPVLIYVRAHFNGEDVVVMVDTRVTYSFNSDRIVEQLSCKLEKYSTHVKAMNSESRVIKCTTQVQAKIIH